MELPRLFLSTDVSSSEKYELRCCWHPNGCLYFADNNRIFGFRKEQFDDEREGVFLLADLGTTLSGVTREFRVEQLLTGPDGFVYALIKDGYFASGVVGSVGHVQHPEDYTASPNPTFQILKVSLDGAINVVEDHGCVDSFAIDISGIAWVTKTNGRISIRQICKPAHRAKSQATQSKQWRGHSSELQSGVGFSVGLASIIGTKATNHPEANVRILASHPLGGVVVRAADGSLFWLEAIDDDDDYIKGQENSNSDASVVLRDTTENVDKQPDALQTVPDESGAEREVSNLGGVYELGCGIYLSGGGMYELGRRTYELEDGVYQFENENYPNRVSFRQKAAGCPAAGANVAPSYKIGMKVTRSTAKSISGHIAKLTSLYCVGPEEMTVALGAAPISCAPKIQSHLLFSSMFLLKHKCLNSLLTIGNDGQLLCAVPTDTCTVVKLLGRFEFDLATRKLQTICEVPRTVQLFNVPFQEPSGLFCSVDGFAYLQTINDSQNELWQSPIPVQSNGRISFISGSTTAQRPPQQTAVQRQSNGFSAKERFGDTPRRNNLAMFEFGDVTFSCSDGQRVKSYCGLLASRSEYFHKMFRSELKEGNTNNEMQQHPEVKLNESGAVVQGVIRFLMTNELRMDVALCDEERDKFLYEVWRMADRCCITELIELCRATVIRRLNPRNALKTFFLAYEVSSESTMVAVRQHIVEYLWKVIESIKTEWLTEAEDHPVWSKLALDMLEVLLQRYNSRPDVAEAMTFALMKICEWSKASGGQGSRCQTATPQGELLAFLIAYHMRGELARRIRCDSKLGAHDNICLGIDTASRKFPLFHGQMAAAPVRRGSALAAFICRLAACFDPQSSW